MKKIIIIIAISIFSVIATNAQKSTNYVSFANSNKDTLQYLKNNFENQKAKYIGQPLSKIFNDLELKILYHYPINRVAPGMTGVDKRNIAGISLSFYNHNEYRKLTNIDDKKSMQLFSVTIYTKELLLRSEYNTLLPKDSQDCDAKLKALYSGTNYVVENIEVTPYLNAPQSRTFYRNNCGANGVGSAVTINIPAGTYFSYYSQADADTKAQKAGQDNANLKGTCN